MLKNKLMGILGGAFDPIHRGHLHLAYQCIDALSLDQIRFIPCQKPVLKNATEVKPWQRAAMVALAIVNEPRFILDTRELERQEPSYALLTLQSLTQDFPDADFFWLLGEDAFAEFTRWYHWQELAPLCNLVVVSRVHHNADPVANEQVESCFLQAGHRVSYLQMPYVDVASTHIRAQLSLREKDLPANVFAYICENGLYPSVSSQ